MQMLISSLSFDRLYYGDLFVDLAWHHYCLTFSGESGLFTQFADGKKAKAEAGIARDFDGGGTLTIADRMEEQGYQMTGFNLWDHVLPPEEIRSMATSCLKGIGNVKNWFDFADPIKVIPSLKVNTPSSCEAPVPQAHQGELEEAENPVAA